MAAVVFTSDLQEHVQCPPVQAAGTTARAVLDAVFAQNASACGDVLDQPRPVYAVTFAPGA